MEIEFIFAQHLGIDYSVARARAFVAQQDMLLPAPKVVSCG